MIWYGNKQSDNKTKENDEVILNGNQKVPLSTEVQLRYLIPEDLNEVRTLCSDFFPIEYPLQWYEDITSSNRFYSLAAIYNKSIIGLIVAEIKPYSKLNKEDRDILSESMKDAEVAYILSLGVHRKYRRNGIGSLLLDTLLQHLQASDRQKVKSVFLHVLTTNQTAILFYERRNFVLHSFLPYYYSIKGKHKDGFSYVAYINGGRKSLTLVDHVKYICSVICAFSLIKWILNRFRAFLRWICYHTFAKFNFT